MKRVLLISVTLVLVLSAMQANALTVENIGVSETGGIEVSGGGSASGGADASANVQSVVQSDGSNTHVKVNVHTSAGGEEYATTVERTIQSKSPLHVTLESNVSDAEGGAPAQEGLTASSTSKLPFSVPDALSKLIAKIFNLLFFFW